MEPNYLACFMVALREYVTAECQAVKADLQGRKLDADFHRLNASRFDTELVNQLQALDARLQMVEQRSFGMLTVGCAPAVAGCALPGAFTVVCGNGAAAAAAPAWDPALKTGTLKM